MFEDVIIVRSVRAAFFASRYVQKQAYSSGLVALFANSEMGVVWTDVVPIPRGFTYLRGPVRDHVGKWWRLVLQEQPMGLSG